MSVFNGASRLDATLKSILNQTFDDFELVIIDDGSTDATQEVLNKYNDTRMRLFSQANQGLTRALIRGCALARGAIIARHDCGDVSHPQRLARQVETLTERPDSVLVSCHTLFRGPEGETLYVTTGDGDVVRQSLLHDGIASIRGISHHGSAMFRRAAYVQAGGYRPQFRVAQDLDLWIRLAPLGRIVFVPEVLYEAAVDPAAISARNRTQQIASARIALQLRDTHDSETLLAAAASVAPSPPRRLRRAEADTFYFIAGCLRRRRDPRWREYARLAVRRDPFFLRAWLLFARRTR